MKSKTIFYSVILPIVIVATIGICSLIMPTKQQSPVVEIDTIFVQQQDHDTILKLFQSDSIMMYDFDTLKVGQIWQQPAEQLNPFEYHNVSNNRILALEDNYVLYVRNEKDTMSDWIGLFTANAKLIKR